MHTDREQTTTALSKTFNNLQDLVLFFAVVGMCKICFFNSQRQGFAEFVLVLLVFWFSLFCQKYWTIHNGAWSTSCLSGIPKQHFSDLKVNIRLTLEVDIRFCSSLCRHYFVRLWEWIMENFNSGWFLTEPILKMCLDCPPPNLLGLPPPP